MIRVTGIASGSTGNAILVRGGKTSVLIDAGISAMKTKLYFLAIVTLMLCSCAPQREFVQFGDAGIFRPQANIRNEPGDGEEYDSYEVIDHGTPNHGVPPMYGGQGRGYAPTHYPRGHDGGYPKVMEVQDQYGNRDTVIIPNPW
jgi:hypothetical protein